MAIFAASIVLLLNIWGGRQAGIVTDANREMAQVHKCMRILKSVEDRYVKIHLGGFRPDHLFQHCRFSTGGRFWSVIPCGS
jgi:hypothetical protein